MISVSSKFISIVSAATFAAGALQAAPVSDQFTSFISFGDSLSDTGNVFAATNGTFPPPPFFEGRFSDGPIWVDAITNDFDMAMKPSANFAFGGAKAVTDADPSPDLDAQIGLYVGSGFEFVQGDNPLASVFVGGNDLFAIGGSDTAAEDGKAVAMSLGASVDTIVGLGITTVALWNAPDVSRTPRVTFQEPENFDSLNAATNAFNAQIAIEAARLRAMDVTVFEVDIDTLFDDLFADPASIGIANTLTPCLSITLEVCADPDSVAFFDDIHPNSVIQGLMAEEFIASVTPTPIPLPASALLMLAGLGALGAARHVKGRGLRSAA